MRNAAQEAEKRGDRRRKPKRFYFVKDSTCFDAFKL